MSEGIRERPQRLLTACLYLGLICAFQVINVFVELGDWDSIEGQARVKSFTDPLLREGMSVGDAELALRVLLGFVALVGASGVVFAIYTALRHAASRVLLSGVGSLIALYCLAQGSIITAIQGGIVVFCLIQLWSADVRAWFAGETVPVSEADPFAAVVPPPADRHPHAHVGPVQTKPAGRQDWVKILSIVSLSISSVVALGCGFYLLMYEFAREDLVRQQLDSGMNWMDLSEAEVRDSFHQVAILSWVVLALCLVAIIVSTVLLVGRRRRP